MTRSHRAPSRKDRNHDAVARYYRQIGAEVDDVHADPIGCDLLVKFRRVTYWVEIKDGTLPLSRRRLTPREEAQRQSCMRAGVPYHLVRDINEAACALGLTGCNHPAYMCGTCGTLTGPARFRSPAKRP